MALSHFTIDVPAYRAWHSKGGDNGKKKAQHKQDRTKLNQRHWLLLGGYRVSSLFKQRADCLVFGGLSGLS